MIETPRQQEAAGATAQTPVKVSPSSTTPAATQNKAAPAQEPAREISAKELAATFEQLLGRKPGSRTRNFFWFLGVLLLVAALATQYVFFNRDTLARQPRWQAHVHRFCEILGCSIRPRQDVGLVELAETTVAPHPKYENALRVRTTLINRANFKQPYPLIEISLSDRRGELVARRSFTSLQYLKIKKNEPAPDSMSPNVVYPAQLDITNPGPQTEGYEIRLVAH